MAVDCMREQLLEGKKIRLGDLGDFSVSLSSKGAETADKFSAQNITGVNVVWDCGQEFKNLNADAEFNLVASRSAQAAVLKAVKAGSTTVDLTGGNDDDNDNPDGSNTPDGGGSNGSTSGGSTNRQFTISVTSADTAQGTVTGGGTYSEGSRVNISATAKSGYVFDKWSDGNTSATRTVTMNANTTLVASFIASTGSGTGSQGGGIGDDEDRPNYI